MTPINKSPNICFMPELTGKGHYCKNGAYQKKASRAALRLVPAAFMVAKNQAIMLKKSFSKEEFISRKIWLWHSLQCLQD